MTEPEQPAHFTGFAGFDVPRPGREVLAYDPAAGAYGETGGYFRAIGQEHATAVMTDVLRMFREPGFRTPYDFATTVIGFTPTLAPHLNLGGEFDYTNDHDYVTGFTSELAEEAWRMRYAVDALQRGESFQPTLYSADGQRLGDWATEFRARRGVLPISTVMTAASQFDELARTISLNNEVELPQRLRDSDLRRALEAEERVALGKLAAAIDHYSIYPAAPNLVSATSELIGDHAHATERDRRAARVAVLDTANPDLFHGLSADRAQVVHDLLPEYATRPHPGHMPTVLSTAPRATDHDVRAFAEAVDRAWTWVAAQPLDTVSAADLAPVSDYLDAIADTVRRDPALADRLPSVQAGLVRHLAEHHLPPDDATRRPSDQGSTPAPDVSADRGGSEQVDAPPATAPPPTSAFTPASSRHQPPGTPGTRHTSNPHQPGSRRTR